MKNGMVIKGALCALAASCSQVALAQSDNSEPAAEADALAGLMELSVIVVTAQRREQSLQDVPLAVTALSNDDLSQTQIRDVSDLAILAPSLTYTQSTNQLQSSVRIRGIGTQVFAQSVEPSVSFVVDGVVLGRQGQALTNLIDIERVEVLRGPQGTLFGKNSSAGVINILTQRPTDTLSGRVSALYAENDEYELRGTLSGPLSDTVSARVTGFHRDRPGHIDNVFDGRDLNGNVSSGGRAQLQYDDGVLNLRLIGDYTRTRGDCCQWQVRSSDDPAFLAALAPVVPAEDNRQTNVAGDVQADADDWGLSLEANYDLANHTITSITAYREWDFENNTDVDSTPVTLGGFVFDRNGNDQTNQQFTQEIRLTSNNFDTVNYIVGAYFFDLSIDGFFEREITLPVAPTVTIPIQSIANNNSVDTTNVSVFADVTVSLSDQFEIFGGIRAIYEELTFETSRDNFLGGAPVVYDFRRETDDWGFAGRAGVRYEPSPNWSLYASYSRSYKGKAIETADTATLAFLQNTATLDPETGDSFEVGAKYTAPDNTIIAGISLFRTTYDDFQAQGFNPDTALSELFNVGSTRTQGVELDFTVLPVDGLSVTGGVALIDATITTFPGAACFPTQPDGTGEGFCDRSGPVAFQDLAGGDLPNAPDYRVNATARYEFDLNEDIRPFIQAGVIVQGDTLFGISQDPNTVQDAYQVVNASFGANIGDVTITGFVRNVFDQNFASFIFGTPAVVGNPGFSQFLSRDAERYFGATIGYRF